MERVSEQIITPWGPAQTAERIAPGITFYSTASHGGYHLTAPMNAKVPAVLKRASFCGQGLKGWYEEDCDWAIVVYTFKEHFDERHYLAALDSLKSYHAEAWDRINQKAKRRRS